MIFGVLTTLFIIGRLWQLDVCWWSIVILDSHDVGHHLCVRDTFLNKLWTMERSALFLANNNIWCVGHCDLTVCMRDKQWLFVGDPNWDTFLFTTIIIICFLSMSMSLSMFIYVIIGWWGWLMVDPAIDQPLSYFDSSKVNWECCMDHC